MAICSFKPLATQLLLPILSTHTEPISPGYSLPVRSEAKSFVMHICIIEFNISVSVVVYLAALYKQ